MDRGRATLSSSTAANGPSAPGDVAKKGDPPPFGDAPGDGVPGMLLRSGSVLAKPSL
jgi:hypothetical protein